LESIPEFLIELIPVIGLAAAAIARRWQSRRTTTISVAGEERERMREAENVSLSPDLVQRMEGTSGSTVVAEVKREPGNEAELVPAGARPSRLTRANVTFALVILFSVAGFAWSIVTLSTNSSSEAKYGATATLGWVFGYWFQPGIIVGRVS